MTTPDSANTNHERKEQLTSKLLSLAIEQEQEDSNALYNKSEPVSADQIIEGIYFPSTLYQKRIDQTKEYLSKATKGTDRKNTIERCAGAIFSDLSWYELQHQLDPDIVLLSYERVLEFYKTLFPDNNLQLHQYNNTLEGITIPKSLAVRIDTLNQSASIVGIYECTLSTKVEQMGRKIQQHQEVAAMYPEIFIPETPITIITSPQATIARHENRPNAIYKESSMSRKEIAGLVGGILSFYEEDLIHTNPDSVESHLYEKVQRILNTEFIFRTQDEAVEYCQFMGEDFARHIYEEAQSLFSTPIRKSDEPARKRKLLEIYCNWLVFFSHLHPPKERIFLSPSDTIDIEESLQIPLHTKLIQVNTQEGSLPAIRAFALPVIGNAHGIMKSIEDIVDFTAKFSENFPDLYQNPTVLLLYPNDKSNSVQNILDTIATKKKTKRGTIYVIQIPLNNSEVSVIIDKESLVLNQQELERYSYDLYTTYSPNQDVTQKTLEELVDAAGYIP